MSLAKVTREVNYLDKRSVAEKGILFNGLIGESGFRISKVVDKGDTFLPLILGDLEETPRGTIIFLKYKLFPGAIFFLGLWSVLLLVFSALFAGVSQEYGYAGVCLVLAISNYFVSIFFFHRQIKSSRERFMNLINLAVKD